MSNRKKIILTMIASAIIVILILTVFNSYKESKKETKTLKAGFNFVKMEVDENILFPYFDNDKIYYYSESMHSIYRLDIKSGLRKKICPLQQGSVDYIYYQNSENALIKQTHNFESENYFLDLLSCGEKVIQGNVNDIAWMSNGQSVKVVSQDDDINYYIYLDQQLITTLNPEHQYEIKLINDNEILYFNYPTDNARAKIYRLDLDSKKRKLVEERVLPESIDVKKNLLVYMDQKTNIYIYNLINNLKYKVDINLDKILHLKFLDDKKLLIICGDDYDRANKFYIYDIKKRNKTEIKYNNMGYDLNFDDIFVDKSGLNILLMSENIPYILKPSRSVLR